MPVTGLRGRQILDGDVLRNDLNITTSGSAVIRRIIANTNISISSTGVDTGTGDVTITATGLLPLSGGTLTGTLLFGNATSPNTHTIQFGDNSGWVLRMMTNVSGTPTQRFSFTDGGTFSAVGQIISTRTNSTVEGQGQIYLGGVTGNRIDWRAEGVAAPSTTTRSVGTKLVLYPSVSATLVDYALGIDSDTMWFSVASTSGTFRWYGGTTINMKLEGANLKLLGNYWSNGVEVLGSDGTSNYLQTGATLYFNTGTTNQIKLSNTGNLTIGSLGTSLSRLSLYTVAGGQAVDGLSITTFNTPVGVAHTTRLYTDTAATTGFGRSIIYAASSNISNTLGQLDVLIENGGAFISRLGSATTGTFSFGVYSIAGVETIRLDTNGTTFFNGGNLSVGTSNSPSKIYVFNTNLTQPTILGASQSTLGSLQDSTLFQLTNLYNSGANGHNLIFTSTAATGQWEYNITQTYGGQFTIGVAAAGAITRQFYVYGGGQIRLANYTTTTSFTGTAVGVLAFTSDGSIITIATPGGGSGLTGTGNINYISKFTSGTSLGNSLLFDNGTDIGIGTATPTTTTNYTTLHINGASGGIVRFSYAGNNTGYIYGSSAETAINAPAQINFYVANVQIANAQTAQFNTYETFYARKLGAQIQIAGAVGTLSGIFQGGSNLLSIADWATALNGIQLDVGNGVMYTRSSLANGGYIAFQRSGTTVYGYVGNSAQLGASGYNTNTELALRSEGGINFLTTSGNPLARMQSTGQLRLPLYTTTTSFTGTAVGVLAFTSDGSIITIATPGGGGSSQWTTSGVNIYYTAGGVSIGTTTTSDILHLGKAVGNDTFIRFDQLTRTTWRLGQSATTDPFRLINASAAATRLEVLASGQLILNSYTSASTYNGTDAVGGLYFDTSGNIISGVPPIYRITFVSAGNFTLTNMASALQFYNNQTGYITRADLSGYKRVRLHVMKGGTSGASSSKIIIRYRTTFSTTTTDYIDIGTTEVSVPINVTNAYQTTSWINLATLAKGDVFIALMQSGGDGSADPVLGNIYAEFDF